MFNLFPVKSLGNSSSLQLGSLAIPPTDKDNTAIKVIVNLGWECGDMAKTESDGARNVTGHFLNKPGGFSNLSGGEELGGTVELLTKLFVRNIHHGLT